MTVTEKTLYKFPPLHIHTYPQLCCSSTFSSVWKDESLVSRLSGSGLAFWNVLPQIVVRILSSLHTKSYLHSSNDLIQIFVFLIPSAFRDWMVPNLLPYDTNKIIISALVSLSSSNWILCVSCNKRLPQSSITMVRSPMPNLPLCSLLLTFWSPLPQRKCSSWHHSSILKDSWICLQKRFFLSSYPCSL